MLLSLLLSMAVALIMVSTIRFWGRPPRKQRVWVATAIGAGASSILMLSAASLSNEEPTLLYGLIALVLISAWLLKTGRDYTKPSKLKSNVQ